MFILDTPPADRHSLIEDAQGILIGATLVALGIQFLAASNLLTGQIAGLSLLINYMSGWSFGAIFFVLNLPFYILAVGPLDYWLLKRWNRREWTWLTFGLIVLGFTGLAFGLAQKWKGRALRINQATVVDADYETGTIRGTAWTHLFSARTSRLSVDHEPNTSLEFLDPPRVITSWQGLPGTGFGGLDRSDTNSLVETSYDTSIDPNSPQLRNLPVPVWSSRSLAGLWWGNAKFEPGGVSLSATRDAVVSGEITNPFPIDLENVYLVYQRWAYPLGTLVAGGKTTLTSETGIDMQTLLTQRQVVKGRSLVTPWDQNSKDVNRILQLLLFYDVAKGRAYTQLHHRYQREHASATPKPLIDPALNNRHVIWMLLQQKLDDLQTQSHMPRFIRLG